MGTVVILSQPFNLARDYLLVVEWACYGCSYDGTLQLLLTVDSVLSGNYQAILIPLGAPTRLPGRRTEVAELVAAPARHVVAPNG